MTKKFETFLETRGLRESFLKYCDKGSYLKTPFRDYKDIILKTLLLKDMPEGEDLWFGINKIWNETLEDMETCRKAVVLSGYRDSDLEREINSYICLGYELFGCTDNKVIMIRK